MNVQKLFGKAKKGFTLTVEKGLEIAHVKKSEEDPEYLQKSELFKSIETTALELKKTITTSAKLLAQTSKSNVLVSNACVNAFKDTNDANHDNTIKLLEYSNDMDRYYANYQDNIAPSQIVKPLDELIEKINALKIIENKRRKNHILSGKADSKLEKARTKGAQPNKMAALEEEAAHRHAKFSKYDNDFAAGINTLDTTRTQVFEVVYNNYQFYQFQLHQLTQKWITEKMSSFGYAQMESNLPSVTVIPEKPAEQAQK